METCNCRQKLIEATDGTLDLNDAHFASCEKLKDLIKEDDN